VKLTQSSFFEQMEKLWPHRQSNRFAVGVSGGSDSLALAVLCKVWFASKAAEFEALVVDHQLRSESGQEATETASQLQLLGIRATVIASDAKTQSGSFQLKARKARFEGLVDYCNRNVIQQLLLGHNLDDQVETFLLRLESGSQLLGLAAMPAIAGQLPNLSIWRPLLPFHKSETADFLREQKITWIEDPSNQKTVNGRIWFRKNKAALVREGIAQASIISVVNELGRWRSKQQSVVNEFVEKQVTQSCFGWASLEARSIKGIPSFQRTTLFTQLISWIRNSYQPLSGSNLEQLAKWLSDLNTKSKHLTLGGCLLSYRHGRIFVCREERNLRHSATNQPNSLLWDQRFLLEGIGASNSRLAPLTANGWSQLEHLQREQLLELMPKEAAYTLPCFWNISQLTSPQLPNLQHHSREIVAEGPRLTFLSNTNLLTPTFLVV
jgi:tRNA(Ile)-lysidine synthase